MLWKGFDLIFRKWRLVTPFNENDGTISHVKKLDVKVIACDIDATLTTGMNSLSDANRRAINELMKKGILFGLASGRAYTDLKNYPEMWRIDQPFDFFIGLNGASLYDETTKEDEVFFMIEREYIKLIVEEIDRLGLDSHIYVNGITLFSKASNRFYKILSSKHRDIRVAQDLSDMYKEKTSKILINVEDEKMQDMAKHFEPILEKTGHTVRLTRTSPGCMEFVPAKANKFYALKQYCQRHGIDMKQVAAFGDTSNDNEMIKGAGIGICMANGTDDTKALADMISEYPCNDDGFARFVDKYIL